MQHGIVDDKSAYATTENYLKDMALKEMFEEVQAIIDSDGDWELSARFMPSTSNILNWQPCPDGLDCDAAMTHRGWQYIVHLRRSHGN